MVDIDSRNTPQISAVVSSASSIGISDRFSLSNSICSRCRRTARICSSSLGSAGFTFAAAWLSITFWTNSDAFHFPRPIGMHFRAFARLCSSGRVQPSSSHISAVERMIVTSPQKSGIAKNARILRWGVPAAWPFSAHGPFPEGCQRRTERAK